MTQNKNKEIIKFEKEKIIRVKNYKKDKSLINLSNKFAAKTSLNKYTYNFNWLGRPIIQYPQDIVVLQELIWDIKPDLIIETGIAHGGSLIFSSSILQLIGKGQVIGIDIEIRKHNLKEILKHPMSKRIKMIEGSSIDNKIYLKVKNYAKKFKKILVFLDSNHTHDHVLKEMELYSKLVSKNSYIVVFDTTMNIFDDKTIKKISKYYKYKPWGKNNNPHSAVNKFVKENKNFKIDKYFHEKAIITNCYDGFLKKIK